MAQALAFTVLASAFQTGVSYLFPSEGPRIKDLSVSASTYGNVIPEVFGTARVGGNMIWSLPIEERKRKKRAGKGGSFYNEYTYWGNFAMGFCLGPVTSIRRIWADGKLIYDSTGLSTVDAGKFTLRIYHGDEEQLPDPLMTIDDLDEVYQVAHRGMCYVVFEDFALADFGNRIPQMAAEVFVGPQGDPQTNEINFDEVEGSTAYQAGSNFPDLDRGYFYSTKLTDGITGIRRFRMDTGAQDRFISIDEMRLTPKPGPPAYDGTFSSFSILAISYDGSPIISGNLGNYTPVYRLSPYSYTETANFGRQSAFSSSSAAQVQRGWSGACSIAENGLEYFLHVGGSGFSNSLTLFNARTLERIASLGSLDGAYQADDIIPVGVQNAKGQPTFYAVATDDDIVTLYRITALNGVEVFATFTMTGSATAADARQLYYDAGSNSLLIVISQTSEDDRFIRYSLDSGSVVWELVPPAHTSLISIHRGHARIENNEFAFNSSTRLWIIDTVTGRYIDRDADAYATIDPDYVPADANENDGIDGFPLDQPNGESTTTRTSIYDSRRQIIVAMGGGGGGENRIIYVGGYTNPNTNLGWIVESLLRRGGLTPSDYDMSDLYGVSIRGYGYARQTDVKSVIQELQGLFLFDIVESDGRLVGLRRGKTTHQATIDSRLLGGRSQDDTDFWQETRMSEADLPAQVSLVYMNADDDFEIATTHSRRIASPTPTMFARQHNHIEASVVFTPTEAKNRVHAMLYSQWGERVSHETRLPWAFLELDPSDRIKVEFPDGRTYFERLHEADIGANLVLDVKTIGQDSGAYEFDLTADRAGSGRTQAVASPAPAIPFFINTPLLRDTDSGGDMYSVYYTAIGHAGSAGYGGATMFRAINGLDYEDLYQEPNDVEWGVIVGTVPPPSHGPFALDWETQITISPAVSWFELESTTEDLLLAGANACLVGDEVIQFRDAVENADGTWTISNLLRGRRGTEYACDTHTAGESFVFLDNNTIEAQGEPIDAHNAARWFKAVGAGRSLIETAPLEVTYLARDLMPYAPTDIRRDASGADVEITWARRTRYTGGWVDGTGDVPLNEDFEAYEVYILADAFDGDLSSPAEPADYIRKYSTTTSAATYSASEMSADGFDKNLDTLHVVIYQLSGKVGRGFPGARSVLATDVF